MTSFYHLTKHSKNILKQKKSRNFFMESLSSWYSTSCLRKPLMQLKDKVAVITGGAGEIGQAIAKQLLCNKAKTVFLVDIRCNKELESEFVNEFGEDKVHLMECNVNDKGDMEECLRNVIEVEDKFDIFINAAGIFNGRLWEEEIQTNLFSTIRNNILVQRYLEREGIILNLCGLQGLDPLIPSPTLSAGFSGVVALSRSFGHPKNYSRTKYRTVALCTGISDGKFTLGAPTRQLTPNMGDQLQKFLSECIKQKNEHCAKACIHVIQYAESGSTWVIDGGTLYSIKFPPWQSYSQLEYQHY